MENKILYILPHISTGGMPQYVFKQIQHFKGEHSISVIEYNNVSNEYVVQKNKIKELCKIYTLGDNKNEIFDIIEEVTPNIIHFQEIPETFIAEDILFQLFDDERTYDIVTTTHSSLTNPSELKFMPDRFVLVNEWSKNIFNSNLKDADCLVWEYPITPTIKDKARAIKELKLNEDDIHIINIGLFTPGKNQKEIFEVAKSLPNIKFHFIGNMADNFKDYWQPLLESKPDNCILWGEQSDTDLFYQMADLFYFSSNFELNPIVVKEALGYRLPILMKNLPVYCNQYNKNPLVTYITNSLDKTKLIINDLFGD